MMKNSFKTFFTLTLVLFLFTACSQEETKHNSLEGKALLITKCTSWHNLGSSFYTITKWCKEQPGLLKKSIILGSENRWTAVNHTKIPPLKKLTSEVINSLSILRLEQQQ